MKKARIEVPSTTGELSIKEEYYTYSRIIKAKSRQGDPVDKIVLFSSKGMIYINGVVPHKLVELLDLLNTQDETYVDINEHKRYSDLSYYQQEKVILESGYTLQNHMSYIIDYFLTNMKGEDNMIDNFNLILKKYAFKTVPKQNVLALINNDYLCIPNEEELATRWSKTLYFPYTTFPEVHPLIFFKTLIKKYNNNNK